MSAVLTDQEMKRLVARNINSRLDALSQSRYWLAKKTGEWDSTIANVCNAKNCCSAGLLKRIAEVLDVTTDWLVQKHSEKKPPRVSKTA